MPPVSKTSSSPGTIATPSQAAVAGEEKNASGPAAGRGETASAPIVPTATGSTEERTPKQRSANSLDALLQKSQNLQIAASLEEDRRIQNATIHYVRILVDPTGDSSDMAPIMQDLKLTPAAIKRDHALVHEFLTARGNAQDLPSLNEAKQAARDRRDALAKELEAAEMELRRVVARASSAASDFSIASRFAMEHPRFVIRDKSYAAGVRLVSEVSGGGPAGTHGA